MKTKLLQLDSNYYRFPEGIKTADEFAQFANNSSQKFVKLTMYSEEHCMEPYFIEEDKRTVWVNLSQITYIEEIDGEVLSRTDYECRLRQVVREKCLDCVNFLGDPDNLEDFIENAYETDEETYSNSFGWITIKAVNIKTKAKKILLDMEIQ